MIVPFGCQRCGGAACLIQPAYQGKTLEELWLNHEKEMRNFINVSEHCLSQFWKQPLPGFLADFAELGRLVA